MPRRRDLLAGFALIAGVGAGAHCSHVETTRTLEVGHHRLQLVVPEGWEYLDHGRQHLFRHGELQISLADMGVATQEGLVRDLRRAEALWRDGRHEDAVARIRDLRGPMFQGDPEDKSGISGNRGPTSRITQNPATVSRSGLPSPL